MRQLRCSRDLSQRELAEAARQADEACALHQSRISEYENAAALPDWAQLDALCVALDLCDVEAEQLCTTWRQAKSEQRRSSRRNRSTPS